jgi:hypothetical protein
MSILTGTDVTTLKSEVTIVFSGKFYIFYQKGIEMGHLEAGYRVTFTWVGRGSNQVKLRGTN